MLVALLLALIWAGVLVPPAVMAHRERQEAFMVSLGQLPFADDVRAPLPAPQTRGRSGRIQRRRRIAGGLLIASVTTLCIGLLPTFRVLLVVHLFLVDSLIGYLAGLAHLANRAARASVAPEVVVDVDEVDEVDQAARASRRWSLRPADLRWLGSAG